MSHKARYVTGYMIGYLLIALPITLIAALPKAIIWQIAQAYKKAAESYAANRDTGDDTQELAPVTEEPQDTGEGQATILIVAQMSDGRTCFVEDPFPIDYPLE